MKTRRPIVPRMTYNSRHTESKCFLQGEDGVQQAKLFAEIQENIRSENSF